MSPRPRRELDAKLQEVYDRIPPIDCAGRCWTSCGPIEMSLRERQRIRMVAGIRITPMLEAKALDETFWCEALDGDRRCRVYEMRPVICRLWGVVEGMPCPYGCKPEGGYLTNVEGLQLIADSMRVGGGPPLRDLSAAVREHPEFRRTVDAFFADGRRGDLRRALDFGGLGHDEAPRD